MSHSFHAALTLAALLSLTGACTSDQKTPQTPDGEPAEAPVMTTTPPAGEDGAPAPNGQPAGLPQAEPPPQGL